MRKLFFTLVTITIISCENDIESLASWQDTTVIYGLLDANADTNWIRIQRGYLSKTPLAHLKESDSLYYHDVGVILESFELNKNSAFGTRVDSFVMIKDSTSKKPKEGAFTNNGFYLFRTQEKLSDKLGYKVSVIREDGTLIATAKTKMVETHKSLDYGFRFRIPGIPHHETYNGKIEWFGADNAGLYQLDVYFYYDEVNEVTQVREERFVKVEKFVTLPDIQYKEVYAYVTQVNDLYRLLSDELTAPPPNTVRYFKRMKFSVWAGGKELSTYLKINNRDPGINNFIPDNGSISNGTGLLSSRTELVKDNIKLYKNLEHSFYLSNALCNKGFVSITGMDTCHCEFVQGESTRVCL